MDNLKTVKAKSDHEDLQEAARQAAKGKSPREMLRIINKLWQIANLYDDIGLEAQGDWVRVAKEEVTRDFVIWHLDYRQCRVTEGVRWQCYKMADGFGPWTPELEQYMLEGLDWSHIRDSSPTAYARIANYLTGLYYSYRHSDNVLDSRGGRNEF